MTGVYLQSYLAPFEPWLNRADVTDILVNRAGELWIEENGGAMTRVLSSEITETALNRLARQVAAASHQGVNREQPLLSATLPSGARIQIVAPPATREGLALAIRKHTISNLSLDQLAASGLFARPRPIAGGHEWRAESELAVLLEREDLVGLLKAAVRHKKTIVISGGTSTGKTTLLNALVHEIPRNERLIVIEDAPEIRLEHPNSVGLIATRGEQGEARIDADDLLRAAMRMRPDRILLGELRGNEAFAFLRAVNSGHPGSITTVHADSPDGALEQIALLAMTSGLDLGWSMVRTYVRNVIDVVVQLDRQGGTRRLTEARLLPRERYTARMGSEAAP